MASGAVYDQLQRDNRRATRWLQLGSVLLVAIMVWVVAHYIGMPMFDPVLGPAITASATIVGTVLMLASVRAGPRIALRAAKARPVTRAEAPQLHNVFGEVCASAGLHGASKPSLYIVDDPAPNAFATGLRRDDAHVAVTRGLVERLPRYELRAVLAHEVAHILNDDIKNVTVAVATAGVVGLLADLLLRLLIYSGGGRRRGGGNSNPLMLIVMLAAIVLAPLAAHAIRFAVSRQREFLADATAADLLRDPQSMVNALRRIHMTPHQLREPEVAVAHLWFDEPNDVSGEGAASKLSAKFATHPSLVERVERLAQLNGGMVRLDAPMENVTPGSTGSAAADDVAPPGFVN